MKTEIMYLNRRWAVVKRDDGFVLTYAHPAKTPAHLTGRTLLVTPGGVYECKRDGSGVVARSGRNEPFMLEGVPDPVTDEANLLAELERKLEAASKAGRSKDELDRLSVRVFEQRLNLERAKTRPVPPSLYQRIAED